MAKLVISQGIYEHYKSTTKSPKYYQVLLLSHDEATLATLVHYQPLYYQEDDVYDDGITVWTRTFENFTEKVEWQGKLAPRFKRISP